MASALAALAVGALALVPFPAAGAGGPDDGDPAVGAVSFLNSQQAPDGGFGPGPLTPNAVSAIAQQAQTTTTWSAKEAIDAVSAVETDDGATPLDALDALAEDDPSADLAAQMISRAVVAMGLDPENFDPAGDGTPVDLVREVAGARREDGSYGSLTATAEAVLALVLVDRPVNEATLTLLQEAQQGNGGWNGDGDPDGDFVDPATTGLVVEALVAAGVAAEGTTPVTDALAFLARTQDGSGGWPADRGGAVDPDATSWAMGALRAAGYSPAEGCWRPEDDGAYADPTTALVELQDPDGAITGGLDPVTSTALAVQAIEGRWLPVARAAAVDCTPPGSSLSVPPSLVVLVVVALVLVVGSVVIMRRSAN
ncbi:MAG: terpene cyclase/mutase family protein [Acidimicrobiales bacterium]|nr:terpene cyclase/mutase family protein [Acidimicrobiales bacterium]